MCDEGLTLRGPFVSWRRSNQKFQHAVEDARGDIALKKERQLSAGIIKATDPFARLPMRPITYYTTGKSAEPVPAALPEPVEETAAPASLAVDVAAYRSVGDDGLPSPGFSELVSTPRDTPRGTASGWATGEESAGKGATLAGARASAHDVDIDIDVNVPAPAAPRPRPVAPRPSPAAVPAAPADGAPLRTTLSVSDYKRRAGIA